MLDRTLLCNLLKQLKRPVQVQMVQHGADAVARSLPECEAESRAAPRQRQIASQPTKATSAIGALRAFVRRGSAPLQDLAQGP